jgi:hypothetical protein
MYWSPVIHAAAASNAMTTSQCKMRMDYLAESISKFRRN